MPPPVISGVMSSSRWTPCFLLPLLVMTTYSVSHRLGALLTAQSFRSLIIKLDAVPDSA